jgi:RNA polymerase sigma-70 factor (ECF subfamily)
MEQPSDAELAQRAAQGDDSAFAVLVRRYQNSVYEMSCRYLRDRDAGFDAAQEVFLKAHRALDRYDPNRKFSTWILAITRNHCIDQVRKPSHRLESELPDDNRLAGSPEDNPAKLVERADTTRILVRAVDELPPNYREAVQLYHYQGLTYTEAAEVQGVPQGTYMARLHRARRMLRDKLRHLLGNDDDTASDGRRDQPAG